MENVKNFFRWLAVLPGAIIALILSYAVVRLFIGISNWFVGVSQDSFYMKITEIGIAGLSGYYFVYIGSKIAPSNKKTVAYVLTGIIFLLGGMTIMFDLQQSRYYEAIASAATAIGGMVLLYSVNSGELDLEDPIIK
jgi:hypothetical protein